MSDTEEKQLNELYTSLEAEDKSKKQELEELRQLRREIDEFLDVYGIPKSSNTLQRLKYAKGRLQ